MCQQCSVLATDLDGTFIPLADSQQNRDDLAKLAARLAQDDVQLVFVTGRHLASVKHAIIESHLPTPNWIICDVGTTICRQHEGEWCVVDAFHDYLASIVGDVPPPSLRELLKGIDALRVQEDVKQGKFKLSYYAPVDELDECVTSIQRRLDERQAPFSVIASVDPFTNEGLIDLLPRDASKAFALKWWCEHVGRSQESIVFAGDTGNDLAALVAGYRAIVVGNAYRTLAQRVYEAHRENGWRNRLFLAQAPATSGVLEGCRWFGLFDDDDTTSESENAIGATPVGHSRTHFRIWASRCKSVQVELVEGDQRRRHQLAKQDGGYFAGVVEEASPGALYRYVLDEHASLPDPASRYQPDGVHGPSQIVDPHSFPWQHNDWPGVPKDELIIYELHVGTFTQEGTFVAAIDDLPRLVDLGITAVELMPIAQSPGRWNWGYDGVGLFAIRNTYGTPDDLKRFVDACHGHGLAVLLDVVYNHLGPEGNYWNQFGNYFSRKHHTPWGSAFNFDGRSRKAVRHFVIRNAIYWLDEYRLDGLRLDAVQFMRDDKQPHILHELAHAVSKLSPLSPSQRERGGNKNLSPLSPSEERGAGGEGFFPRHLIAETNVYDPALLETSGEAPPYDAIWCDDIMHSIYSVVAPQTKVTHRHYGGGDDLFEALTHGFLYAGPDHRRVTQGEREQILDGRRADLASMVIALQNHDSIGNHPHGKRIHQLTSPDVQKAVSALILLYPSIPLIFMGEELATESPFRFFVDFEDKRLNRAVDRGRAREYPQQDWMGAIRPSDERAFATSNLGPATDNSVTDWYRDLIAIRKEWQQRGWLQPEYLSVRGDVGAGWFALDYNVENRTRLFVVSWLHHPEDEIRSMPLGVDGVLLLDSRGLSDRDCDEEMRRRSARAIIGIGTTRVSAR